jgi:ubiquinone/menaquinone biosynthesis C-methylase UbiE
MQNLIKKEAESFDSFYEAQDKSPTIRAIFRETLGLDGLAEEFVPYSFVSLEDLHKILSLLKLSEGKSLADIACGNGSLGLWLAKTSGANLFGVDVSASAVEKATKKAGKLNFSANAKFQTGHFENTGLESESVDAIVSIDAVWLAFDQQKALKELARILKKGRTLVFTSWEQQIPMPFVKQPIKDYRPLLEQAGFEISSYEYLAHSEQLQLKIYERVRASQAILIAEMGETIKGLIGEAHFVPGLVDGVNYLSPENGPHILVSAKRL